MEITFEGLTKWKEVLSELVGESCHTTIFIEEGACKCLKETGCHVTYITQEFYEEHLAHTELHPMEEVLQVIRPVDRELPYLGYIIASI